jgi:hypothetical protein
MAPQLEREAVTHAIERALRDLVLSTDDRRAEAMIRGEDTYLTPYERESAADDAARAVLDASGWLAEHDREVAAEALRRQADRYDSPPVFASYTGEQVAANLRHNAELIEDDKA